MLPCIISSLGLVVEPDTVVAAHNTRLAAAVRTVDTDHAAREVVLHGVVLLAVGSHSRLVADRDPVVRRSRHHAAVHTAGVEAEVDIAATADCTVHCGECVGCEAVAHSVEAAAVADLAGCRHRLRDHMNPVEDRTGAAVGDQVRCSHWRAGHMLLVLCCEIRHASRTVDMKQMVQNQCMCPRTGSVSIHKDLIHRCEASNRHPRSC